MGLGLIRVLLALSVVIAHSSLVFGFNIANGTVAVQSFYIISGFYMALILNEKYDNCKAFYINRSLRLYPIYLVVALITIIFSAITISSNRAPNPIHYFLKYWHQMDLLSIAFLIFANLTMIGLDVVMFLKLNNSGYLSPTRNFYNTDPMLYRFLLMPQAWTLGVEILFYFLAPFIVRRKSWFITLIILASFIIRIVLHKVGLSSDPWNYRFFPSELGLFLLGVISYKIYHRFKNININANLLKIITLIVIGFAIGFRFIPLPYLVVHWSFCFMIFITLPFVFMYSKPNKLDRKIGELSYIIYICHILIIKFLTVTTPKLVSDAINKQYFGIIACILSVLLALLLQKYIQDPIEKIRLKYINKRKNFSSQPIK